MLIQSNLFFSKFEYEAWGNFNNLNIIGIFFGNPGNGLENRYLLNL